MSFLAIDVGEIRSGLTGVDVVGSQGTHQDRERAFCVLPRRRELSSVLVQETEVEERDRDRGMIGSVHGFVDSQGTLLARARIVKLPDLLLKQTNLGECERYLRMLPPVHRLLDR